MKIYRKDKLYNNDRDRMCHLSDILKKNRVNDDQQSCAMNFSNSYFSLGNSPGKTIQGKNWDTGKGSSPNKISPNK